MAVEKNNEIIEEEARVTDEIVEQPEGSGPIDISVEGEEEVTYTPVMERYLQAIKNSNK